MADSVKVFVTYSHWDSEYLGDDSLLGYLKGLEKDHVEFWTDREIRVGEPWDEVIKNNLREAQIALVLVSQSFLDSDYCQQVEIRDLLARKAHLFPIILSACEWERHEWLKSRQFLPGGQQTVEEDYADPGKRKRLFLEIRTQLRERVEKVRQVRQELSAVPGAAASPSATYSGKHKIAFWTGLASDWPMLADYLDIPLHEQARFGKGEEGRQIWAWLQNRRRLDILPEALRFIGREDLADQLVHK